MIIFLESLQKRQRKNQFVVRKSEIFKNVHENLPPIAPCHRSEDNLPKIDINSLNQQPNDSNQNMSDVDTTNQILNSTQSNPAKIIQQSSISCTPIFSKSTLSMTTKVNHELSTTFTKITRQIDSFDSENGNENFSNQNSNKTSFFSNIVLEERKTDDKTNKESNIDDLDMILFDGIKIDDDDSMLELKNTKKNSNLAVFAKANACFIDKTNLFTYNNLTNNYNEKMNNFRYDDVNNSKKFLSKTKVKKYNFTFLDFSTQ